MLRRFSSKKLNFNLDEFKADPKNTPASLKFQTRKTSNHFIQSTTPLLTTHLYNW